MEWFVSFNTPARRQLFINSVTLYAYNATDVMDDDNCDTFLESFVIISSLQVAQVDTKKVLRLDNLVLAKKWGISPKKALNTICHTTQHSVYTVLFSSLTQWFRTCDYQ